jgi:hypothetical protein
MASNRLKMGVDPSTKMSCIYLRQWAMYTISQALPQAFRELWNDYKIFSTHPKLKMVLRRSCYKIRSMILDFFSSNNCTGVEPCLATWSVDVQLLQVYEGISKNFRTGLLERELQMVQLFAISCIAPLWVSLVSFASITLCVASQWVFIADVLVYFVMNYIVGRGYQQ